MSIVTTGQITVTDQNDGVSVRLSLESFVAPTAPDGSSPNLTGAATTLSVFLGAEDDSSSWTVTASPSSGVSGSLVGRTYTVTGLTVDSGFVDLTASRMGYSSVTTRFAISKAKKGNRGTVNAARAISGTAWSDTEAATAVNSVSADAPVIGDVVTLYNSNANYSETRVRGSSTWTALTEYLNGNLVVRGSIKASSLLIEDNSNIVPDADYEDERAWTPSGVGTVLNIVPSTSGWNSANLMEVSNAAASTGVADGKTFKVRPGDKLFWEVQSAVGAGTGSCYVQVRYSASRSMSSPTSTNVASTTSTTPVTTSGEITVPAGVRFAQVRLVKHTDGTTSALFGRVLLRKKVDADLVVNGTISTDKLEAEAITTEKLTVLAREFVNNPTANENLNGWGGVTEKGTGGNAAQTFDATEKALAITGSGGIATVSNTFKIDHDKIYRIAFRLKKSASIGNIYAGVLGYTSWRLGAFVAGSGVVGETFSRYGADRVPLSDTNNPFFLEVGSPVTSYTEYVGYLIGANRSIDDCPNHSGALNRPYIKAAASARHIALRFLSWNNGTTTTTLFVKDISVTEVGAGQIVADNISANAVTADKIAADAVTAGKIAANAVTAGKIAAATVNAREIAAGAVIASKITVADFENLAGDQNFDDTSFWETSVGLTFVTAPAGFTSRNVAQIDGAAATYVVSVGKAFEVEAGKKLFLSYEAAVTGGTGSCFVQMMFSALPTFASPQYGGVGIVTSGTVTSASGQVTVPAGMRYARIRLVKSNDGATQCQIGSVICRRVSGGELIVDGAITADKIAANAVEAGKIATGAVTADKISTNAVTAGKIDANAITAREVASNSIMVEKMAIRSLQNLIENPDFENGTAHWTNPTRIVNKPTEAYRGSWVYEYVSASSAAALVSRSNIITVREGDSFYMRGFFKNTAGSTGSWYLQARFYDAAGAPLPVIDLVWTGENTTWSEKEKIVTAPAGAVTLAVILFSVGTGTAYWDEIYLMKAADGRLIVDGAIEAKHVSANAITAEKITADSITVSKILVQDNSNLVPDADFEDLDVWTPLAGTRVIEDAPSGWSSANVLRVRGAAGEIVGTVGKPFRIRAGDTLSVEVELAVTGGVISANSAEFYLLTAAKRNMAGAVANAFLTTNAGTPRTLKSTFVVPNGTRFAQVFVRKLADSSTEVTLGRVVVRNRSTTDLLEDNAVSTIREATITSSTTFAAGTTWNTIGSYTFTPSGDYPISLWLSGKAFLTIATAVDAIFDMRVLWRGAVQLTYTGALVGKGPIDLTSLVSANDRFSSGGATSGALEIQIRSTNGTCRLTNLRILLGEFKK